MNKIFYMFPVFIFSCDYGYFEGTDREFNYSGADECRSWEGPRIYVNGKGMLMYSNGLVEWTCPGQDPSSPVPEVPGPTENPGGPNDGPTELPEVDAGPPLLPVPTFDNCYLDRFCSAFETSTQCEVDRDAAKQCKRDCKENRQRQRGHGHNGHHGRGHGHDNDRHGHHNDHNNNRNDDRDDDDNNRCDDNNNNDDDSNDNNDNDSNDYGQCVSDCARNSRVCTDTETCTTYAYRMICK